MAENSAVDVRELQPAVIERPVHALRHQVDDGQALRHMAQIGFGDADDRRAAALQAFHHTPSAGTNTGYGSSSPPGRMHAQAHALADLDLVGGDVLDPAHQAEALVAVDQRHVEGLAFARMHDGRRVDGAEALAHPPLELVAAGEGAHHARIEHRLAGLGAELIGELALLQVLHVDRVRRFLARHVSCSPLWRAACVAFSRGRSAGTTRGFVFSARQLRSQRREPRRRGSRMKLLWSSRSPFVRKVMVAAHEVGVARPHRDRARPGRGRQAQRRSDGRQPAQQDPDAVPRRRHGALQLARDLRVSRHAARGREAVPRRSRPGSTRCGARRSATA